MQHSETVEPLSLASFVQPHIEPEVVLGLKGPIPDSDDPEALLSCVEWMAPGFEVVHCHFPDWRFTNAECTADFGLHGALVVGRHLHIGDPDLDLFSGRLASFTATLALDGTPVDTGTGDSVLGSPVLALGHLGRLIESCSSIPAIEPGEIITTGTLTTPRPISPGQSWSVDFGDLGIEPLAIAFT